MNKIVTLSLVGVIIFSTVLYAETKLTVSGKLELGEDIKSYNGFAYMELGFNVYYKHFKWSTFGSYRTWLIPKWQDMKFYPYRDIYTAGTKISLFGFFVKAEHFCNHPVKSQKIHTDAYGYENKEWRSNFWGETITTISIGYEFEFPIWKSKQD